MTTISKIIQVLRDNNPAMIFHSSTETQVFCMIPEMGYPFEVKITLLDNGRVRDACDDAATVYPNFDAWEAQNVRPTQ